MIRLGALPTAALLIALGTHGAIADSPIRLGVGSQGPISPQAMYQIEQVVGEIPGVKVVPIIPPGDVNACVRRFVAGDPDDRVDGLVMVSLPPDSFKVERDSKEASFRGTYEIRTLDLSTLAEDRHSFAFTDSEPVTGGMSAILAIPAELLAERTTGTKLISGGAWQAFQTVQARIESKLVAATRLYMSNASIRNTRSLDPLACARHLLDAGEVDTAMAVYKSVGIDKPQVASLVAKAQQQVRETRAETLLGQTLGAIAGGDSKQAGVTLTAYAKEPAAAADKLDALRRAISAKSAASHDTASDQVIRSQVPSLDRPGFIAMVKELFDEQAGKQPDQVDIGPKDVEIAEKTSETGIRTRIDGYAAALARSAWLMSIRCGCEATAALKADPAGASILQARFGPSFARPQVGIP